MISERPPFQGDQMAGGAGHTALKASPGTPFPAIPEAGLSRLLFPGGWGMIVGAKFAGLRVSGSRGKD